MSKATKHIGGGARAWTAALAIGLLGLGIFASAAQAVPATFWGVVPQATPSAEQFQRLRAGGVDSVRIQIDWGEVQPARGGALNWSGIDSVITKAADSGLEVLPFLNGAPAWAVPSVWVPGSNHTVKAPSHLPAAGAAATAWSNFVKGAAARYGPNGSFWAANPTVPKRPIRTWQIWNEENFKYFVAKPSPAEYGHLVKLSYAALKSSDAGAKLLLGGMFSRPKGGKSTKEKPKRVYFASDFLEQMYETTPGIKTKFNGVALHPYTGRYQELPEEIEEVRKVQKANGDAGKGLWITELGWSSQPPPANPLLNIFAKGPAGQVSQLKGAFSLLSSKQAKWRLQRVYWFSVDDQTGTCNFCDGSGLFAEGFVPKKSWFAYVKFAGGTP
ncbi:MAG TPA: glycosyl hydrolase [Solirubrobacterales bacterium]